MVVASLLATPFVLGAMGAERYGLLVLIQLILGYLAVADVGMGVAATHFAAAAHARADGRAESSITWTAIWITVVGNLLVVPMFFLLDAQVLSFAGVSPELSQEAELSWHLAALLFVARTLTGVARTQLFVRLEFRRFTIINNGGTLVQVALLPIVLSWSPTLGAAVAWLALSTGLVTLLTFGAAVRALPELRQPRLARELVRPMARYGATSVGVSTLGLALLSADRLWLVHFTSVTVLAYYSIAFTLARLTAILPGALGQALLPAFSRLMDQSERLSALYDRALRMLIALLIPSAIMLAGVGGPFITAWLGPDFGKEARLPLCLLAVAVVIDGAAYLPRVLLSATGRPGQVLKSQVLTIGPYIALGGTLVSEFGAIGAAMAWTLRVTLEAILVFRLASQREGSLLGIWSTRPRAKSSLALVLILTVALISVSSPTDGLWLGVIGASAAAGLAGWSLLSRNELEWLGGQIRKGLSRPGQPAM